MVLAGAGPAYAAAWVTGLRKPKGQRHGLSDVGDRGRSPREPGDPLPARQRGLLGETAQRDQVVQPRGPATLSRMFTAEKVSSLQNLPKCQMQGPDLDGGARPPNAPRPHTHSRSRDQCVGFEASRQPNSTEKSAKHSGQTHTGCG